MLECSPRWLPSLSAATLLSRQKQRKADKIIKWASEGGFKEARLTWSVPSPLFIPPPSYPGFSPPDPPSDPFVGEKWSRSLEPANYRALTSALLSPERWGTFQQLRDSSTGVCLLFLFQLLLQLCLKRKHLFYGGHKTLQQQFYAKRLEKAMQNILVQSETCRRKQNGLLKSHSCAQF